MVEGGLVTDAELLCVCRTSGFAGPMDTLGYQLRHTSSYVREQQLITQADLAFLWEVADSGGQPQSMTFASRFTLPVGRATAHGAYFHIGNVAWVLFSGSAYIRGPDMTAVFGQLIKKAVIETQPRAVVATTSRRLARSATDRENALIQGLRDGRAAKVVLLPNQVFDLTMETGWTALQRELLQAQVDRDTLVRVTSDGRASAESASRWARAQPPPAGYRKNAERRIERDPEVIKVGIQVAARLNRGESYADSSRFLEAMRIVGPRQSTNGCWHRLEPHEPYPRLHSPSVRDFCRGFSAWLTGNYEAVEHCPLEAEFYLGLPVWRSEDGDRFVTTSFPVGKIPLTAKEKRDVRGALARLQSGPTTPTRYRRHPFSGVTFAHSGIDYAVHAFMDRSGDTRYEVCDEVDGRRTFVVSGELPALVARALQGALEEGIPVVRLRERVPASWAIWLNGSPRTAEELGQRRDELDSAQTYAVYREHETVDPALRAKYAESAVRLSADLARVDLELKTLRERRQEWCIETDLVPRVLGLLQAGSVPTEPLFSAIVHEMLKIEMWERVPGTVCVRAHLKVPSNRGLLRLGPVDLELPNLISPGKRPGGGSDLAMWDAIRWLRAPNHSDLRDCVGGSLSETGRAVRHRLTSSVTGILGRQAAECILVHPVERVRQIVACHLAGEVVPNDPLTPRILATYAQGTFGQCSRRMFLRPPPDQYEFSMVAAGATRLEDLVECLAREFGLTTKGARGRADRLRQRRLVNVEGEGAQAVYSLRECACGGRFSLHPTAPEVGHQLLCDRCLADPTGQPFPPVYREMAEGRITERPSFDLTQRRAARTGQTESQAVRQRAEMYGLEVNRQGRLPKLVSAEVARLDGVVATLLPVLHDHACDAACRPTARQIRELLALDRRWDGLTKPHLENLVAHGDSKSWRMRGEKLNLPVGSRGPVGRHTRLQVLLTELKQQR